MKLRKSWKVLGVILALSLAWPMAAMAADDPAAGKPDYVVKVNRALNITTVYAKDATGEFTQVVQRFRSSTGRNNKTTLGTFAISEKYRWKLMIHSTYTQYALRYHKGEMLHSPYYTKRNNPTSLAWKQFNLLGQQASAGCVREATIDAKWLYDNCKVGTPVIVYGDPNEAVELPHTVKIPADSPARGWDPTDPDPTNPWAALRPVLFAQTNGVLIVRTTQDVSGNIVDAGTVPGLLLPVGASAETLKASFGLMTPEGAVYAPETWALEVYGICDLNTPGDYEIYVRGFDLATTLRADATFIVRVVAPQ